MRKIVKSSGAVSGTAEEWTSVRNSGVVEYWQEQCNSDRNSVRNSVRSSGTVSGKVE